MWEWGWAVQLCRWWGDDFCKFCAVVNRAFYIYLLHRNPTFIGVDVPRSEEKPPTEAGG